MEGMELDPVFPDTKAGRKMAEDYSMRSGEGGFWEEYTDTSASDPYHCTLPDGTIVEPEILALVVIAEAYVTNPNVLNHQQAEMVGQRLAEQQIVVPGMPVDLTVIECHPTPSEVGWIAWKVGRGPRDEGSPMRRRQRIKRLGQQAAKRFNPIPQEDGCIELVPIVKPKPMMHRNYPA